MEQAKGTSGASKEIQCGGDLSEPCSSLNEITMPPGRIQVVLFAKDSTTPFCYPFAEHPTLFFLHSLKVFIVYAWFESVLGSNLMLQVDWFVGWRLSVRWTVLAYIMHTGISYGFSLYNVS